MPYRMPEGVTIETIRHQIEDIPPYLKSSFEYWNNLRKGGIGPSWQQFDLMSLSLDVIPTTQVVDWLPEEGKFRYRFYGTGYATIHGVDLTGKTPMDLPVKNLGIFIHNEYLNIVREGKPNIATYGFHYGGNFSKIETCLRLPLSDDGCSVTGIVTVDAVAGNIHTTRNVVESLIDGKINFPREGPLDA